MVGDESRSSRLKIREAGIERKKERISTKLVMGQGNDERMNRGTRRVVMQRRSVPVVGQVRE